MTVTFAVHTEIAAPIEMVFDLARDIDVHVASQSAAGEQAVAGVTTGLIGPGGSVTFCARHFGVRFSLTGRVVEFEPPNRFVDEQVRGPFRAMRHEHRFTQRTDGIVTMTDALRFSAPLGPIGWVVERLVLERHLRNLIVQRGAHLKAEAERRTP